MESINKRINFLEQETFKSFLTDPEFSLLITQTQDEMIFTPNNDEEYDFEPGAGYTTAIHEVQKWLDRKGHQVTHDAIALAIARKMDPTGAHGYDLAIIDGQ